MILNDQGKKEMLNSDLHQYFDIELQSDITDNNIQFVNFVLPLSKIAEFYDINELSKMFNDNYNNVIFTSGDNKSIYRYEYYQKVFFIRMYPYDSTLRMHFIPKKYDASDANTGNSILVFKDNSEHINSSNFYCTEQYDRNPSKNTVNLEYKQAKQETSNGFYKFDIKDRVKNFNCLQINLGYMYNDTRANNYVKHYTGIIDESNQYGQKISPENFTEFNRALIDCNGDNRCDYTNKIVQQYVDSNGIDWDRSIVRNGGFDNYHVPTIYHDNVNNIISQHSETSNKKYTLFRGDCWTIDNNYEASAAITSTAEDNFTITGTLRTKQDMIGIYWNSSDIITHPYISYGTKNNYTGVTLDFDYEMSGCKDFSNGIVSITVRKTTGEIYYLTMARFIENGHFHINFDTDLIVLNGGYYIDAYGNDQTASEDITISPTNIQNIMFVIIPENYEANGSQYEIMNNVDFICEITNIEVTNGDICNEFKPLTPHQYRLCEGYDDFYNLNPYRVTKEMRKLGYVDWLDLYIGASHYYEKKILDPNDNIITDLGFNHNRTGKMVLDTETPLNKAFAAWLDCYARELKANGTENFIISVSMENLQCPDSWKQKDVNNNFALTGWVPSTFFYSPCCNEAIEYMQSVSEACLDIVVANDMQPILQLGEAWWWWNVNDIPKDPVTGEPICSHCYQAPCFYDAHTKAQYFEEFGQDMPEYESSWEEEFDEELMAWLNQKLVEYCDQIREVSQKSKYEDSLYMALFFPPSVVDVDEVPLMIQQVNYIKNAYSPEKLDILQLEDYDWVIGESIHHKEVYTIGQELGFPVNRIHYYGGFVQYPEDAPHFWRLIKDSMIDAFNAGFAEVFVWAGSQIRRDARMIGYEDENYENKDIYHKTLKYFNGDLYVEEDGLTHYESWSND